MSRGPSIIHRRLDFSFGHRLATDKGPCRQVHGHNARVDFEILGKVDDKGILVHFTDLKQWLATEIHDRFDHKTVLRWDDDLVYTLADVVTLGNAGWQNLLEQIKTAVRSQGYWDSTTMSHNPFKQGTHLVLVGQYPTTENLSYLIHCLLGQRLAQCANVKSLKVTLHETEKNAASYMGLVALQPEWPFDG